ncbi:SGNH/GDSL hydrolase family protein [Thomasclavelia spiroformis DSM 1552]|uniref:GDSL-like protein n=1 Tax=Thomasclavelia spiroformis DSM 1552 TaxID=428126 RepID=B1C1C5_9FIRM|nr:SGNH/GDSL hydrolase family protein [Thomasclavelia spiroformis]EDS75180.1 GDSL-like protein [Thomasclavelia spiroformis DSM 1552]UWO88940.1 SGNH/GDSL hydrolase family protein [Thomasclavelia spiroformis DSM 1552]
MEEEIIKIAIFGDSISEGIGSRKINYSNFLKEKIEDKGLKCKIYNYAYTGTTIKYMETLESEWKSKYYDYVIIFYGNVDGMLRPNQLHKPNYFKYLPKRYKQNGMLNPRPYFSSNKYKRFIQKLDSNFRCFLNKLLLNLQGTTVLCDIDTFENIYKKYLEYFKEVDTNVITISTVYVDDKYFPGTNFKYLKYNSIIKNLSINFDNVKFIDMYKYSKFYLNDDFYYEDYFHPNENGYKKIAQLIFNNIYLINNSK